MKFPIFKNDYNKSKILLESTTENVNKYRPNRWRPKSISENCNKPIIRV